eukprot:NODE_300_length_11422_cov_0.297978.p3 type:complete len:458 gc:universal NODE_300_length_11422_cov_0.297978:8064-9437(+)
MQVFKSLQESFKSGKTIDLAFRKQQLQKLIEMLINERDPIQDAVYKDLKKRPSDVLLNEIQLCINEAKHAIVHLEAWSSVEYVEKKWANVLDSAYIKKDPKGVALIIAPWNFPVQLSICPLVSLIASGCVGIVKPSEIAVNTSACLAAILNKYLDPACYAVIEGDVKITTDLLKLPFDHIFYTGSTAVGKIIMKAAAEHLSTVTLELGGANACFVDNTVDLKIAAKRIAWLKTNNCGQICLSINYLFITPDLVDSFVAHYKQSLIEMYGADVANSSDYTRIINSNHFDRILKILDKIDKKNVLLGGQSDKKSLYIAPTVVKATLDDKYIQDELFAPILPIIPIDDLNKGIEFAAKLPKPLASYVFSHDSKLQKSVVDGIISGTAMVNDVLMHAAYTSLPFGGCGASGQGSYHGQYGFNQFTYNRAVLHRPMIDEPLMTIRYPPLTDSKVGWLNFLAG